MFSLLSSSGYEPGRPAACLRRVQGHTHTRHPLISPRSHDKGEELSGDFWFLTLKLGYLLNKRDAAGKGDISPVSLPFWCWPPAVGRCSSLLESRRRSWSHTQHPDHRHLLGRRSTTARSRSLNPQIWAEVDLKKGEMLSSYLCVFYSSFIPFPQDLN